ncbi:MAG: hypothetical protein ACLRYY_11440 [Anaerobutyricum soehngenii]
MDEVAQILDITQYLDRKPKALSGGRLPELPLVVRLRGEVLFNG